MSLARCPECGRVADGTSCFACGYEWPAGAQPAQAPAPAPDDSETDFSGVAEAPPEPPPPPAPAAPAATTNPFASNPFAPAPVSSVSQAPVPPAAAPAPPATKPPADANPFAGGKESRGPYEGSPAPPLALDDFMDPEPEEAAPAPPRPPPPPAEEAAARGPSNPFAGAGAGPVRDEDPFASLDGPLAPSSPSSPSSPSAAKPTPTPAGKAKPPSFDPFDGEEMVAPSTPPPLPADALYAEDDAVPWEAPTEKLDAVSPDDESATSQIPAALARKLAAKAAEEDVTLDLPMEARGAPLLVDDDPGLNADLLDEQPTLTTARTPASMQPLHERLWSLGKRLEDEGRLEEAALIFEAAMCLEVEG